MPEKWQCLPARAELKEYRRWLCPEDHAAADESLKHLLERAQNQLDQYKKSKEDGS